MCGSPITGYLPISEARYQHAQDRTDQISYAKHNYPNSGSVGRPPAQQQRSIVGNSTKSKMSSSTTLSYSFLAIGAVALTLSLVLSSVILVFVGLGLVFWGVLFLFIRPMTYVRCDLMEAVTLSSIMAIDKLLSTAECKEKGVYLPTKDTGKVVAFIPHQQLTKLPNADEIENQVYIHDPRGVALVPPGLALANLIEQELGVAFRKGGVEALGERLRKPLIESLEIMRFFEMRIDGDIVTCEFVEPVYSKLFKQLHGKSIVSSSLGCPFCSAMACVIVQTTGRPVRIETDELSRDGRIVETTFRLLEA